MLQYIINTTAIWLISLVMFDLFLRRESYHAYNRAYLLSTFLLGILLPLIHWQYDGSVAYAPVVRTLQPVVAAKESVVNIIPVTVSTSVDWLKWLGMAYLAGIAVAAVILLIDVLKLVKLYHNGNARRIDGWKVIETDGAHAPFSFGKTLFVRNRVQYTDEEWQMILNHEARHNNLLHVADLLLMQISRIVLWMHPLVYVYNKRLQLVHEYQADNVAMRPREYGAFLVEQGLLGAGPVVTHSFNSSSIKRRLVMLRHQSSVAAKTKLLVFIPVLLVCIVCFTQSGFSKKPVKKGNFCNYRGNTIEFLAPKQPDSYMERDEVTGELHRAPISWPEPPIKLNGQKIYDPKKDNSIAVSKMRGTDSTLAEYILRNTADEFKKLDDGDYFLVITDVVIDAEGKLVYFNNQGIFQEGCNINKQSRKKRSTDKRIDELMADAPPFEPAKSDGNPVAYVMSSVVGYNNAYDFTVKDHKVSAMQQKINPNFLNT